MLPQPPLCPLANVPNAPGRVVISCLLLIATPSQAEERNVKGIFILTFDDRWGKLIPVQNGGLRRGN